MNLLISWLVFALSIGISAYILPGVKIAGTGAALVAAVVLAAINAFIKPVLVLLTLPVNILTLGLFTFVINALLVLLAASILDGFDVANFWWALAFSLVLSLVSSILESIVK